MTSLSFGSNLPLLISISAKMQKVLDGQPAEAFLKTSRFCIEVGQESEKRMELGLRSMRIT